MLFCYFSVLILTLAIELYNNIIIIILLIALDFKFFGKHIFNTYNIFQNRSNRLNEVGIGTTTIQVD